MAQDKGEERGGSRRRLAEAAAANAHLLLSTDRWLHRRVYQFGETESGMTSVRVSVDLTLDPSLVPVETSGSDVCQGDKAAGESVFFVPLLMLRKWPPLLRMDITRDGRTIPLLTSDKNREVDAATLRALAPEGQLKNLVAEFLDDIATGDKARATEALDTAGRFVTELVAKDAVPADEGQAWRQTLLVASSLVSNSIIWARVVGRHHERVVVKVAYEDLRKRELVLSRRILASLGLAPTRLTRTFPNAGDGRSFHVQVDPPPELRIHRAKLEFVDPLANMTPPRRVSRSPRDLWWALVNTWRWRVWRTIEPGDAAPGGTRREEVRPKPGEPYEWETPQRAYLYASGLRPQAAVAQIDFTVDQRNGFKSSALAMATAIAALMTFITLDAGTITTHEGSATALMLIVPALITYLIVRPGEHPALRSHIAGIRVLLIVLGFLPVVATAVLLSFKAPRGCDVFPWWLALAIIGWLLAGVLAFSRLLPFIKTPYESR